MNESVTPQTVAAQSGDYSNSSVSAASVALPALASILPGVGPSLAPLLSVLSGSQALSGLVDIGYNGSANSNTPDNLNSDSTEQFMQVVKDWLTHEVSFARENRQFNSEEAQKLRDWQEMMSNTSYQRAMADMKKAGLNPILAYQQGGASVPGGSAASFSSNAGYSTKEVSDSLGQIIKYIISMILPDANHAVSAAASLLGGVVKGG